ncbi:hypothetical protein CEV32_3897 [Brucella rhizosphaerae]|uniref:Uncharacterized protein n=2 Tax=Brucella TaxID=234 RepID=A0A256FR36_9HYPH|nr:hypothetical protein CEV32_3897 [Brucella rhizosphaerae]OYR22799.1 hypothetical protein CEV34_4191 [Brucella pseudogrignonensis]
MVVAGGHAAAVLETVDEALDAGTQGVEASVDAVLHLAAPLGRDLRLGPPVARILPQAVTVVAPVTEQHAGIAVALGHEVVIGD